MFAEERQSQIIARLARTGRANVAELATDFAVTPETIRRDLDFLEAQGLLLRVHGGAVGLTAPSGTEVSFIERQNHRHDQKMRIARAALDYVPAEPAASMMLDAGTTTGQLAKLLTQGPNLRPTVFTNAVSIAAQLVESSDLDVELLGGKVRSVTSATVGSQVLARVEQLRPDISFLGANGISATFAFSTPDTGEAAVKTAFARAARTTVVLADATKFGVEALVRFVTFDQVDVLITDQEPPPALQAALAAAQVEVVLA